MIIGLLSFIIGFLSLTVVGVYVLIVKINKFSLKNVPDNGLIVNPIVSTTPTARVVAPVRTERNEEYLAKANYIFWLLVALAIGIAGGCFLKWVSDNH